jgi:hypothetical protein
VVSLGIFFVATDGTMCTGVDSDSENEYQDIPGGKDGRCHLHFAESHDKSGSLNLPDPQGPVQACSGKTLLLLTINSLRTKMSQNCI